MRTTVTIHEANNYLRIDSYSPEFLNKVIMPFTRKYLCLYKKEQIPGTRKSKYVIDKVFGRLNNDKSELRISRGLKSDFLAFLQMVGYATKRALVIPEPEIKPKKVNFEWNKGYENYHPERAEEQKEWCDYQISEGPLKVNNGRTGMGKGSSLDAKIKVPGGWKRMGDIRLGEKVITRDGTATKVLGVFPQGLKQAYRFHFADGRSTEVDEDHLWKVYDISKSKSAKNGRLVSKEEQDQHRWGVITTKEILKKMEKSTHRLYVPLCESEKQSKKEFPIDPYLLGVILGDGCSGKGVTISKPYQQLFDKVQSLLPDWMECKWLNEVTFSLKRKDCSSNSSTNVICEGLRKLDLFSLRSWEKFIPSEYFEGSTDQRLALLQGLLDTDGTVEKSKTITFSSSSKNLSEGVQYLVRSLGGYAKITPRTTKYTHHGKIKEGRADYRVVIRYPRPQELFTLDHKKERAQPTQYSEDLKLKIVKVEDIGMIETQCISVEHCERLYITDDFIVTHNTWCGTNLMVRTGEVTLITCLPRYVSIWMGCLPEYLKLDITDIVVMGEGLISDLADNIENGVINPKIIILPLTRYDRYLKEARADESIEPLDSCFQRMGIGLRIMDESHESLYQVYMSMMFGNFKKTLALSATLIADDDFKNRIYSYIYPCAIRHRDPVQAKYIDVFAYHHNIDLRKYRIKVKGFSGYNHVMYEQSIMKSPYIMDRYYELVKKSFEEFYVKDLLDKQRCLFFFATVEMCKEVLARLKRDYPDYDIVKFTAEESASKTEKNSYKEHQVVITTPQSCGTGKDIPYLYVVISPYAASSRQRNAQMLGRLRTIEKWWPDLTPKFVYFVCDDIEKQVTYHQKRMTEFKDKSKSIRNIASFHRLE